MGKNNEKAKTQRTKKAPAKGARVNDLPVKDATGVKGGTLTNRKTGGTQQEYLKYEFETINVT